MAGTDTPVCSACKLGPGLCGHEPKLQSGSVDYMTNNLKHKFTSAQGARSRRKSAAGDVLWQAHTHTHTHTHKQACRDGWDDARACLPQASNTPSVHSQIMPHACKRVTVLVQVVSPRVLRSPAEQPLGLHTRVAAQSNQASAFPAFAEHMHGHARTRRPKG